MIQRYKMKSGHKECSKWIDLIPTKDDTGEWVKWDDIKHLMPFQEELDKYLDKYAERLIKGTSTKEPISILADDSNAKICSQNCIFCKKYASPSERRSCPDYKLKDDWRKIL